MRCSTTITKIKLVLISLVDFQGTTTGCFRINWSKVFRNWFPFSVWRNESWTFALPSKRTFYFWMAPFRWAEKYIPLLNRASICLLLHSLVYSCCPWQRQWCIMILSFVNRTHPISASMNQWRNEIKFWKSLIERTAISILQRIESNWVENVERVLCECWIEICTQFVEIVLTWHQLSAQQEHPTASVNSDAR